jgi:Trk K+ transport system NAD-binding subunit
VSARSRQRRHHRRALLLYAAALLREFRITILLLLGVLAVSTLVRLATPMLALDGRRPSLTGAVYGAWIALVGQPADDPSEAWQVLVLDALSPLAGLVLIGEGVVRFGLLMVSRRRGEKEWMKVMASTYRNHVVLCGLGHLGFRILEQLLARGEDVVAIERDAACRFLPAAKATGIPVLLRDMKEDQALLDAGVAAARAVVIASNDDMANLEVALDARRMNPGIRVLMRMFDQQIATKIRGVFTLDAAFSASALAAPVVAAMVGASPVLASFRAGSDSFLAADVVAGPSGLAGATVAEVEARHRVRVLSVVPAGAHEARVAAADTVVGDGDRLVVGGLSDDVSALLAATVPA